MENKNVTVIIPARNEENNISNIINFTKKSKSVTQIIVVDNASTDKTYEIASTFNVDVVRCENAGKGYAMETGLHLAKNDVIVYLDADIENYYDNMIEALSNPIINDECDFVKSTFDRETGGVVTEIAVKPLLLNLFPDMYKFSEPISGMIGCKKEVLEKLVFDKDYGVDIGILIDIVNGGYRFKEINIGRISNNSHLTKTTQRMQKMSIEVMAAILRRANLKGE